MKDYLIKPKVVHKRVVFQEKAVMRTYACKIVSILLGIYFGIDFNKKFGKLRHMAEAFLIDGDFPIMIDNRGSRHLRHKVDSVSPAELYRTGGSLTVAL